MIQQFHFQVFTQRKWKQLERFLHLHVLCGIIYSSQGMEAT